MELGSDAGANSPREGTQHPVSKHEASWANEGSRASLLEHTPIATEARSALLTPLIEKALSRPVVRYARTGLVRGPIEIVNL